MARALRSALAGSLAVDVVALSASEAASTKFAAEVAAVPITRADREALVFGTEVGTPNLE